MTDPRRHTGPDAAPTAPPSPPALPENAGGSAVRASEPTPPERKNRTRRILGAAGRAALAVLLILLLTLGIGTAFLRSAPGEAWLAAQAVRMLAAAGITATLDSLEGPLPERLRLRNLTLSDGRGPWLHLDEAKVRLRPLALLHGTLDVELVRLSAPRWERMPDLPATGSPKPKTPTGFDPPALPLRVRLDELDVRRAVLGMDLLGRKLAFSLRGALDAPPGSVSVRMNMDREPLHADYAPNTSAPDAAAPGGLALALSYTARTGDLQLDAAGGEDTGGLLGCLIGQPGLPAYGLRMAGHGTGGRWRGWLAASAGDLLRLDGEADVELDTSAPGIAAWLAGRKDSAWRADLRLTAQNGADAPAELRRWMGGTGSPGASGAPDSPVMASPIKGVALQAQASGNFGRTGMTLDIPRLTLDGGAWNLELADATLHAPAGTAFVAPTDLRATVRTRVHDVAALLPDAPLRAAEAALALNGSLNTPDGDALALRGRIDLRGVAAVAGTDIAVDMDGNLRRTGQRLILDGLRLALDGSRPAAGPAAVGGPGGVDGADGANGPDGADGADGTGGRLDAARPGKGKGNTAARPSTAESPPVPLAILTGSGTWDAATRHATATLAAELPDLPALSALPLPLEATHPTPANGRGAAPRTSGSSSPADSPLLAGSARMEADVDLRLPPEAPGAGSPGAAPAASAPGLNMTVRALGAGLRWNAPQARYLLGPSPALSAEVTGGYAAPLRLELRHLTTARLSGRGTASLGAPAPHVGGTPGLLPPVAGTTLLDASARFTVTGVNGLLAPDEGATGQTPLPAAASDTLTLNLDARGTLAAPTARLTAALPHLELPVGTVRGLAARLDADLRLPLDHPVAAARTAESAAIGRIVPAPLPTAAVSGARGLLDVSAVSALNAPLAVAANWWLEQRNGAGDARLEITRAEGAGLRGLAALAASWNDMRKARDTVSAPAFSGPILSGTVDLAVADWTALSRAAGTSLSGDDARLRIWLGNDAPLPSRADAGRTAGSSPKTHKPAQHTAASPATGTGTGSGTMARASRTAPHGSAIPLHAEATANRLAVGGVATLDALSLTLRLPNAGDMPPTTRGTARLRTGPGTAAGLAWDAADATLDLRDDNAGSPGAAFGLSLRGRSTANVRGGYDAAAQILRLDTLHLSDAAHAASVDLTRPADIQLAGGVRMDGLHLALSATPPLSQPAAPPLGQASPPAQQGGNATGRPAAHPRATAAPATGTLDLSLGLRDGGNTNAATPDVVLDAALTDVPLRVLRLAADLPLPEGRISGSASLRGQGGSGSGAFVLEAEDVAYPDPRQTPAAFRLSGTIRPAVPDSAAAESGSPARRAPASSSGTGLLHATLSAHGLQADMAEAEATLPLRFNSGLPRPDLAGDMTADIRWRGPMAPVWRFVPLADRHLSGMGSLTASLRGPVGAPRVEAEAFLCGGRYEDLVSGVLLTDIRMDALHEDDGTLSIRARLGDGRGGTAAFEGRLSPPPDAGFAAAHVPDAAPAAAPGAAPSAAPPSTGTGQPASPPPAARHGLSRDLAPRIDLRGQLLRLSPLHRDDLSLTLSGSIEANGPLTAPLVRADITVPEGELRLLRGLGGGVTTLEVTEKAVAAATLPANPVLPAGSPPTAGLTPHAAPGSSAESSPMAATGPMDAPPTASAAGPSMSSTGPRLDLRIVAPQRFFIRGRGLDSEWRGDLRVAGSAASPALTGTLSPVRGRFDLLAKPFSLSRGNITFTGEQPPNPALDLDLTNEGPAVTAVAHVGGTARRPALALSSTPPLPQDEVMSYVLFGKPLTELSRFEALQAANALRTLSGAGGDFDVLTSVRRTLGVDVLRVGSSDPARQRTTTAPRDPSLSRTSSMSGASASGEQARPTLEAGKYLLDNVYVGVEQGTEAGATGARVEVELLPRLNLEGRSSPTSSELGIMWKKDY
uniref:Translocation and assembly module TamB C-terminal domain-containing protein n=1 Tax=Nitratidesulfovibrio vulgaris (strain DSM 19637 / Miyazaki F) TaxID=883 RepID=B8DS86_NITV9